MRRLFPVYLVIALLCRPVSAAPTYEERLLASAQVGASGPSLLEFLRKRSLGKVTPEELQRLIRQLGEANAEANRAQADLIAYGPAALNALRDAHKDVGPNKAKPRLDECLRWIEGAEAPELLRAVVRRLGQLRPAGTVAALLSFLTRGEEDALEEAKHVLATLALRDGKLDPVLEEAAFHGTTQPRRLAAIEVLCQAEALDAIRKLLRDPSPEVRLHTASLRLEQGDAEAMPVLIELLATLPKGPRSALEPLERLAGPLAPSPADMKSTRDAWAAWWKATESDSLIKYFKERTPAIDPTRIGELVELLGSKSFKARMKAEQDLINLRGLAIPWLEKASKHEDIEIRRRVERCLAEVRDAPDTGKSAAQVRLLTLRRPAATAQVLLAYVAFADAEPVVEEVRQGLRLLARRDPAIHVALKTALSDRVPQRRAVAAEVLADTAAEEALPSVRKLLTDPEATVRMKAALGLTLRQEKNAVAVLIELLNVLPEEQARQVEDMLRRLANDKGPNVVLEDSAEVRKKCRDLWQAWWKENSERVSLAGLRDRPAELGLTLVSLWSGGAESYVIEMGRDQKERWRIGNLGYVFDFVVLPGQRLLLVENTKNRVTERNFKGDVLWQYDINGPINCQRLPNGNVFIACSDRAVIVNRQKSEVTKFNQGGLMGGQRFRDGKVALLDGGGSVHIFDADGKPLHKFQIEGGMSNYGGVQETSNGHFLVAQHHRNKVSEYDLTGKLIWSCESPSPNFATRLRNGHTAVGSQDNRSMLEFDRSGKKVLEYRPGVSVWRIRHR